MRGVSEGRKLARRIRKAGAIVELRPGSTHYRATNPDTDEWVTFSSSPSDCHAIRKILRDLRRIGIDAGRGVG